ncbi:MAG: hypothetical protein A6F72_04845 [Cycloclasticus sp. symbiont of Poecilosclerida sp. N]|nr:MAG: hypothetical protein A6F72_04845 [Cycloclasticus sp. symbiont of Poecilosclerida sp. N]
MIIQANLTAVNITTEPKRVSSKQAEKNPATRRSTPNEAERVELFEQIEPIVGGQKPSFRTTSNEKQTQALRDELREQMGIDLEV